ncbi:MAG: alpha/beta hydrolase [Tissierellia bacterium]|nr:alpha/beta hydrolase [Tissierellia bacterium]
MFYGAMEGSVDIGDADMDYVAFGKGQKPLILIPGLGDGLKTVKGTRLFLARAYKLFAEEFSVYVFSRKNYIEEGYSTKDMARDQAIAMDKLGIESAHIMGVSQGGMIAQYIAIDHPELVDRLILGVSVSRQNDTMQKVIRNWIVLAEDGDYKGLIIDTMEKTFTEDKLRRYRKMYPAITRIGKPKDFNRFIIQAHSCLNHNAYEELDRIICPTLIIGGDADKVVGEGASEEMAERIYKSKLILYEGLGHGAYEEAEDFNERVLEFCLS